MKTWKKFGQVKPRTGDEAVSILSAGKGAVIAGGTDILGALRFEVLPIYPEVLVNLKSISGLEYIKEEAGMLKNGALTRLEDIAKRGVGRGKYTARAEGG